MTIQTGVVISAWEKQLHAAAADLKFPAWIRDRLNKAAKRESRKT
jgi:hypothetical protein